MVSIKIIILLGILEIVLIELALEIHDLIKSYKVKRIVSELFDEELEEITMRVNEERSDTAKQAVDEEIVKDEQ